eukprot:8623063-Pyramimonas_sp.AAC.1
MPQALRAPAGARGPVGPSRRLSRGGPDGRAGFAAFGTPGRLSRQELSRPSLAMPLRRLVLA